MAKAADRPPTMRAIVARLTCDYPQFNFDAGPSFCWSPGSRQIIYKKTAKKHVGAVSLLHELGHALLGHERYRQDLELLQLEIAAWEQAKQIAPAYNIAIDEEHIQDCLDSYRDWLHRRSICPQCATQALQQDDSPAYTCFNCHASWQVAPSRFCRPYRRQSSSPDDIAPIAFAASQTIR